MTRKTTTTRKTATSTPSKDPTLTPPEDKRGPRGDWMDQTDSAHIRAQVERLMPVLTMVRGTAEVQTLDAIVKDVCIAMSALRRYRDEGVKVTANCGGIRIAFVDNDGDNENYELCVVASKIYGFQVEMEQLDRGHHG